MTYMLLLNCALKLVEEIILSSFCSKKHTRFLYLLSKMHNFQSLRQVLHSEASLLSDVNTSIGLCNSALKYVFC